MTAQTGYFAWWSHSWQRLNKVQTIKSFLFISPWSTVNLVVVCVTFFFFSTRCPEAADRSPNSDRLSGNLPDCPHLLDHCRLHKHTNTHKQTATVKHAGVRSFDLMWLLTAAFFTTERSVTHFHHTCTNVFKYC